MLLLLLMLLQRVSDDDSGACSKHCKVYTARPRTDAERLSANAGGGGGEPRRSVRGALRWQRPGIVGDGRPAEGSHAVRPSSYCQGNQPTDDEEEE